MRMSLAVLIVLLSVPSVQAQLDPGRVTGDVVFENLTSCVADYLTNFPVSADVNDSVFLYKVPNASIPTRVQYKAENQWLDVQHARYKAASFVLSPTDAPPGGADYVIQVGASGAPSPGIPPDGLALGTDGLGGFYDCGFPRTSASVTTCPDVRPLSENPVGNRCDLSECAALLNIRLHFSVDAALQAKLVGEQSTCELRAYASDGQTAYLQAVVKANFPNGNISPQGVIEKPILVRSPQTGRVDAECTIQLQNQAAIVKKPTLPVPTQCGVCKDVDFYVTLAASDIPAGRITGYFDISNALESLPWVHLYPQPPSATAVQPTPVDAGIIPAKKWEFQGVPAQKYVISASAFLTNGRGEIHLPSVVSQLSEGQQLDLGGTFVSKPVSLSGKVVLTDRGRASLQDLRTQGKLQAYGSRYAPPISNGISAEGGSSSYELSGTYDSTLHAVDLDYSLALGGLSPVAGDLSGSDTLPTAWDVSSLSLRFMKGLENQGTLSFNMNPNAPNMHFAIDPSAQTGIGGPTVKFCVNRYEPSFILRPTFDGTMCIKSADFTSTVVIPGPDVSYSHISGVGGHPVCHDPPAGRQGSISLILPAAAQYKITPTFLIKPQNGSTSTTTAQPFDSPASFPCGAGGSPCVSVDGAGHTITNAIEFVSPASCFETDDPVIFRAKVSPVGATVANAQYYLDESPTPSGQPNAQLEISIPLNALAIGDDHLIKISADLDDCPVSASHPFSVRPVRKMTCPADLTVALDQGETTIGAHDPRVESKLSASLTGGCGGAAAVTDDRPVEFHRGVTSVAFTANSGERCTTRVTITAGHELSFIDGTGPSSVIKSYFLEQEIFDVVATIPSISYFTYDGSGKRILVFTETNPREYRIVDRSTGLVQPANSIPSGTVVAGAFHPVDADVLALISKGPANEHFLHVLRHTSSPTSSPIPFPSEPGIGEPVLAWSRDGKILAVMFCKEGFSRPPFFKFWAAAYPSSTAKLFVWSYSRLNDPPELHALELPAGTRGFEVTYPTRYSMADNFPLLGTSAGILRQRMGTRTPHWPFSREIELNPIGIVRTFKNVGLSCQALDISKSGRSAFCFGGGTASALFAPFAASVPVSEYLDEKIRESEVAVSADDEFGAVSDGNKIYVYEMTPKGILRIAEKPIPSGAKSIQFR